RVWGPRDGLFVRYIESNSLDWDIRGGRPGITVYTQIEQFDFQSETHDIPLGEDAEVALSADEFLQIFSCRQFDLEGDTGFGEPTLFGDPSLQQPLCGAESSENCGTVQCDSFSGSLMYRYLFNHRIGSDGCTLLYSADTVTRVYRDAFEPAPADWPCPSPWDGLCLYGGPEDGQCRVPDLQIATGSDGSHGINLHLIQEGGSWMSAPDDCSFWNPIPDWGAGGRPIVEDGCVYAESVVDGDEIREVPSCLTQAPDPEHGSDVLTLPEAADRGTYLVGAEAFLEDRTGPVDIYVRGQLIHSEQVSVVYEPGTLYVVGEISFPEGTFRPIGQLVRRF
ncbi:MAG: hypothetical protein KC561_10940, partial [Myxococcales bacterium]|nr:hypothetical protein [Myxococcales bacterium]